MAKNEIQLIPSYWANVSGGKDSLYMLYYILQHLDRYPLDGVVNYELEIDYPFIHDVIDEMEKECRSRGIAFLRLRPRVKWVDLYKKYGMPSRRVRWCNGMYKLDCVKHLEEIEKRRGRKVVHYIGFCADETKRFRDDENIYPLAEAGINENVIWTWAQNMPIYHDYYKINRRCGCMMCPCLTRREQAYLYIKYPEMAQKYFALAANTEKEKGCYCLHGQYSAEYIENRVLTKWVPIVRAELDALNGGDKT